MSRNCLTLAFHAGLLLVVFSFHAACSSGSGTTCEGDSECAPSERCQNRTCVEACVFDTDCGSGLVCRQAFCVPPSPCDSRDDCRRSEVCEGGICVPQQPQCARDSDCAPGFTCVQQGCYPPGAGPDDSGDGGCTINSDCPGTQVCLEGSCRSAAPECREDRDCAPGLACEGERCVEGALDCREDRDCSLGEACDDGTCAPLDPACTFDSDCLQNERCEDSQCVPDSECQEDRDCSPGRVCEAGSCEIDDGLGSEECRFNSDCASDERCDGGSCVSALDCMENRDCDSGEECLGGFCVEQTECQIDSDCGSPGELECIGGRCECMGQGTRGFGNSCSSSTECCSGLCIGPDNQPGTCTRRCTGNLDCATNDPERTFFCGSIQDGAVTTRLCIEAIQPFFGDTGQVDCIADIRCPGDICLSAPSWPQTPLTVCSYQCQTTEECPPDATCALAPGQPGPVCVPFVGPCNGPEDCFTGECYDFSAAGQGRVCTMPCNPSQGRGCGAGFVCAEDPDTGGAICAPPGALE